MKLILSGLFFALFAVGCAHQNPYDPNDPTNVPPSVNPDPCNPPDPSSPYPCPFSSFTKKPPTPPKK